MPGSHVQKPSAHLLRLANSHVFTTDHYLLPLPASSLTLTWEPALLGATSYCLPLPLLSPILLLISTYFPRDETKILHIIIFCYYFNFLSK